ncbi:MAG: beta strand repeat-containing protein, partial [Parvicellaceae bacterium]
MRLSKIIFFALLFAFVNLVNAQTNWTGNVDSDWDDAGNWSAGIPDASDAVTIPDVTNDPVINIPGAVCGALTIESSGLLTSNNGSNDLTATSIDLQSGGQISITNGEVQSGNFTHAGVLTITGGTLDINGNYTSASSLRANINGGTIELAGDWDGTAVPSASPLNLFNPSGGTVFFNGGTQAISTHSSNNFHNLTIGGTTNTKTAGSDLVINGNLLISSGTLDMAADANTLDVAGNFTLSGVSFIPYGGTHDIAGNWDDSGSGNAGFAPSAGKIILSGGTTTTIATKSDNKFFNLEINKSSSSATCNSNITVGGVLDFEDGTLDIAANTLYPQGNLIRNSGTISGSSGCAIHYGTAGTYDICAFSDNDIEIKLLNTASGAVNLTTAGNIDCEKIWLNKSTHVFLVDGETINVSDEINIQSGKFQITSGTVNINSNDYNDIHLQASTSTLDIDGGTINVGNNSNSSSGIEMADGTLDLSSGTLNIDHNIKIDAGTVTQSGGTISVKHYVGDFDGVKRKFLMSTGILNLTAGTLRLNGQNADGGNAATYPAIDIASSVTVNANANHVILVQSNNSSSNDEDMHLDFNGNTIGDLTINLDGHSVIHQTDVNLLGDLTLTAGTLDLVSTSVDVAGNWDDSGNNGGFTPSAGTVTLSGAGSDITTGSNNNFFNLVINSSGAKSAQSELDINGDLTVTDGELAMGSNNADVASGKTVTIASSKTLSMSSGVFTANGTSDINGTLSITTTGKYDADGDFDATGGTITFGGAGFLEMSGTTTNLGSSFTEGSGTVEYDGTSSQTIFNTTYNNLLIDQNSTKTASANLDVDGNLTIDNSATLDMSASNYNLTIDGNYTLTSGTFTSRTGTVTFNGAGAQSLTPGSSSFYNLTTATNSTNVTLQADIT